jgi:hypothetical protein
MYKPPKQRYLELVLHTPLLLLSTYNRNAVIINLSDRSR